MADSRRVIRRKRTPLLLRENPGPRSRTAGLSLFVQGASPSEHLGLIVATLSERFMSSSTRVAEERQIGKAVMGGMWGLCWTIRASSTAAVVNRLRISPVCCGKGRCKVRSVQPWTVWSQGALFRQTETIRVLFVVASIYGVV